MNSSETPSERPGREEEEFLERLARVDPASPALLPLARAYLAEDKPGAASELARRVLAAHPDHLEAALVAAQALAALGHSGEAGEVLDRAAARLDELAPLLQDLSGLFDLTGRTAQADRVRRAAQALAEERAGEEGEAAGAVPTPTLAELYVGQGHLDKALEIYERLLEESPQSDFLQGKVAELRSRGRAEPAPEPAPAAEEEAPPARARLVERLRRLEAAARRRREALRVEA